MTGRIEKKFSKLSSVSGKSGRDSVKVNDRWIAPLPTSRDSLRPCSVQNAYPNAPREVYMLVIGVDVVGCRSAGSHDCGSRLG